MTVRRLNDLGGQPGGPIDRTDLERAYWEKQVDAIRAAIGPQRVTLDEQRREMEEFGPELYGSLAFYERRLEGMLRVMVAKGLVDREELERRVAARLARQEATAQ